MSCLKRCSKCRKPFTSQVSKAVFCCGVRHVFEDVESCPVYNPGATKAAICRSNQCGFYDAETDCCLKIVEIGLGQGRDKPGHISYLYSHPSTKCPANPPMWDVNPVARIGFLSPVYARMGGTETWHKTLLPKIRGAGFVSLAPASGNLSELKCWAGTGEAAAKQLAASVDVLVVWGVGKTLDRYLPKCRKPKIVTVMHTSNKSLWGKTIVEEQAEYSDVIVAVNESGLSTVPESFSGKKTVIYNGVNPARVQSSLTKNEAKAILGARRSEKVVVSISRLSKEKRIELLLEASRRLPEGYRIFIAGFSESSDSEVVDKVLRAPRNRVTLLPAVENPANILRAADCFVSCSEFEGFGLSAVEAILAGVPVVSTPVGVFEDYPGMCTFIDHGIAPEDLADVVKNACEEPLPSCISDFAKDMFSADRFIKDWNILLEGLSNG